MKHRLVKAYQTDGIVYYIERRWWGVWEFVPNTLTKDETEAREMFSRYSRTNANREILKCT